MEDSEVATSTPSKAMAVHASSQSASSAYRLLSPSFYTSFLPSLWGESRGPEVEIAVIDGKSNNQRQLESEGPCLIFHVHGGGFISQSSKSHISYLKQWAATTGIPILSIDYRFVRDIAIPLIFVLLFLLWLASRFIFSVWHQSTLIQRRTTNATLPTNGFSQTIVSSGFHQVLFAPFWFSVRGHVFLPTLEQMDPMLLYEYWW